jgi:hypothetical protein
MPYPDSYTDQTQRSNWPISDKVHVGHPAKRITKPILAHRHVDLDHGLSVLECELGAVLTRSSADSPSEVEARSILVLVLVFGT